MRVMNSEYCGSEQNELSWSKEKLSFISRAPNYYLEVPSQSGNLPANSVSCVFRCLGVCDQERGVIYQQER